MVRTISSLYFHFLTRSFILLTETLRAAITPRLTGGSPAQQKSLSMKAGSSVSMTFLISRYFWAYLRVMEWSMGSQLMKTMGWVGSMTGRNEGGTARCQSGLSLSCLFLTYLLASCSSPLYTSALDSAIIFSFIRYCFLSDTLQLGIFWHNLSNKLTPMPQAKACLERTSGCNWWQSPITTYFSPRISALTQFGYKLCDASSTITTSNLSGKWWMCSEDSVTNHTRLLPKYLMQSSIEVKESVWAEWALRALLTAYCEPYRMRNWGSILLESISRSRMLSSERLVQVVTRILREWLWKQWMRRRMSSVLPVPGMPSIRHSRLLEVALRKASVWSEFKSTKYQTFSSLPSPTLPSFPSSSFPSFPSSSSILNFSSSYPTTKVFRKPSLLTSSSTALLRLANMQLENVYISRLQSMLCSSRKPVLDSLNCMCWLFISMTILKSRLHASTEVYTTLHPSNSYIALIMHRTLKEGRQNSSKVVSSSWLAHLRSIFNLTRFYFSSSRGSSCLLLSQNFSRLILAWDWLTCSCSCSYMWIMRNQRDTYSTSFFLKEFSSDRMDSCYLEGREERSTVPGVFQMERQESQQMEETSQQLHWEKVGGKGGSSGVAVFEVSCRMFCAIWLRCAITISYALSGSSYLKNLISESEQYSNPITGFLYFSFTSILQISVCRLCESLTLRPVFSSIDTYTPF